MRVIIPALLVLSASLVIVDGFRAASTLKRAVHMRRRVSTPTCSAAPEGDDYDDDDDDVLPQREGPAPAPRGFGGFGAALDDVDAWMDEMDAEDEASGAILSEEVLAKRNKILLKWSNFVRTAGGGTAADIPVAALRNVNLDVADESVLRLCSWEACRGQLIGVVGESGCGKSTQLRLLAGEISPSSGEVWHAEGAGEEEEEEEEDARRPAIEHVRQTVLADLAQESRPLLQYVRDQLGASEMGEGEGEASEAAFFRWIGWEEEEEEDSFEGEDVVDMDDEDEDDEINDDEERLGAEEAALAAAAEARGRAYFGAAISRPVCDFSSGQQLRIAISMALARRPRLLLCDEPTNHLDVGGLLWLEGALRDAVSSGEVDALVAVSHDRAFLEGACTHILDASGGGANLYAGAYSTYLRTRQIRVEALGQREASAGGAKGAGEGGKAEEMAAMVQPAANERKAPSRFRFQRAASGKKARRGGRSPGTMDSDEPMLRIAGADVRAGGQSKGERANVDGGEPPVLLRDAHLEVRRGECVVVVGPNGIGKSSLLRAAVGEDRAIAAGERTVGEGVAVFSFGQDAAERLSGPQTAAEALRAAWLDGAVDADGDDHTGSGGADIRGEDESRMFRVMKQLGIPRSVQHTPLDGLSGGEKARLCIAQMLLSRANLLILDEPTNHLDLSARAYLQEAIRHFDGGVILASHDRHFAAALATRLVALDAGAGEGDGVLLSGLPSYETYLEGRPKEAKAFDERADADRRRLDAEVSTGARVTVADLAAPPKKVGRRAAARRRRLTNDGVSAKPATPQPQSSVAPKAPRAAPTPSAPAPPRSPDADVPSAGGAAGVATKKKKKRHRDRKKSAKEDAFWKGWTDMSTKQKHRIRRKKAREA